MAEVYGERVGQGLADTEWLNDAGRNGWVVLMKDDKIRYRPAEPEALMAAGVRAFCFDQCESRRPSDGGAIRRAAIADQRDSGNACGALHLWVYADGVRPLWPK